MRGIGQCYMEVGKHLVFTWLLQSGTAAAEFMSQYVKPW